MLAATWSCTVIETAEGIQLPVNYTLSAGQPLVEDPSETPLPVAITTIDGEGQEVTVANVNLENVKYLDYYSPDYPDNTIKTSGWKNIVCPIPATRIGFEVDMIERTLTHIMWHNYSDNNESPITPLSGTDWGVLIANTTVQLPAYSCLVYIRDLTDYYNISVYVNDSTADSYTLNANATHIGMYQIKQGISGTDRPTRILLGYDKGNSQTHSYQWIIGISDTYNDNAYSSVQLMKSQWILA